MRITIQIVFPRVCKKGILPSVIVILKPKLDQNIAELIQRCAARCKWCLWCHGLFRETGLQETQTEVQQAWMKDYGLGPPVEGEAWFNQNVLNRLDVVRNEDCLSVFCPEAVDEILH